MEELVLIKTARNNFSKKRDKSEREREGERYNCLVGCLRCLLYPISICVITTVVPVILWRIRRFWLEQGFSFHRSAIGNLTLFMDLDRRWLPTGLVSLDIVIKDCVFILFCQMVSLRVFLLALRKLLTSSSLVV